MNKKYQLDSSENRAYLSELANELLNFGHKFPSEGGSSYYLGDDGTPWTDRPRETWITSRMAHVYSIGKLLGHEGSEALISAAVKGLSGELCDTENGGYFAGITSDGNILPNKQCYAHAFVILAFSSAYTAGCAGALENLKKAMAIYDEKFWDDEIGLAVDTWDTEFKVLDSYRGINANMHTVEAFLAVADVLDSDEYRKRAGRIIDHVVGWAADNNWRLPEHFTSDWTVDLECNADKKDDPFKPYGATPGHGIEWARLITQWALSTYGDSSEKDSYIDIAKKLYRTAVSDAWNADGAPGIVYTTDWEGKPVVHDRMHWTLAEAINTSAILAHLTGEEEYFNDFAMFMEYLDTKVHDKVNGSWFHQMDSENNVMTTVWPGKSDIYHALQAMIIPYANPAVSIVPGLAR